VKLVISDNERELDVLSDPDIRLLQDGLEMPVVARELTYAESADSDGRRRIRSKNQNAEGRIGLHISGTSDSHFWDKVDNVIELVESAHRNKGSIVYEPPGGTAVAYDLEAITVTGLPQQGIELQNRRSNAEITFECQPYGRLEPIQLITGGTLDGPIDYVTVENVPGQVMAFGDLELTEISSQTRKFLEVGVQADFDPADPEPVFLTAGSMADAGGTLIGVTGSAGTGSRPAGAYTTSGGNSYTIKAGLSPTPSVIAKSDSLPNKGYWKVRARVQNAAPNVRVRLSWRSGESPFTNERWVNIATEDQWVDLDLATVEIPELSGTQSFEIRIEAASASGYPFFDIDTVSLVPADRYLRLRGRQVSETTSGLIAADDFESHSAGTLNGKTPPITAGGNWTGAGTTDFSVVAGGFVSRTASGDVFPLGRYMRAGTAVATAIDVRADTRGDNILSNSVGLFARYVNASNFLLLARVGIGLALYKVLSGVETSLGFAFTSTFLTTQRRISLEVLANGAVVCREGPANSASLTTIISYAGDADTQSGGALASGGYGFAHVVSTSESRAGEIDNFTATTPSASSTIDQPVVFSGRRVDIDQNSAETASSDGSYYAPTPVREGNYLLLPPATRNGQKSRIVVRARRDDLESGFADTGLTDDLTAKVSVTPRVLLK
jgi:hypothetical protein